MNKLFFVLCFCGSLMAAQSGLDRLIGGNKRYVKQSPPNKALVSKQNPFAVIVTCSDSRVPPELIFNQGVGDLFVIRVAGNVIGPIEKESVGYAVDHLKPSIILVMGHQNCGAVDAVVQGQTKDIPAIAKLIKPSVKKDLESSIKANAIKMRDDLRTISKNIKVEAGYYSLETGQVELLRP